MRALFAPETFNLGETTRGIEVAWVLRERGHECRFVGYSHRFADVIREAGFEVEILEPELSDLDADRMIAADQGRPWLHPFTEDMVRARVDSELRVLREWAPDVVVIGTTLTQFISARAAGIPLVYVKPYAFSAAHLAHLDRYPVLPENTCLTRGLNRLAAAAVPAVADVVRWKPAAFSIVAREVGYRLPVRTLDAIEADLSLIASLFPALDGRPLPPRYRAVGPVFARPRVTLDPRIRELAEQNRPLVYLGLGSSGNRDLLLRMLAELGRMNLNVVSSAGSFLRFGDDIPSNVSMYRFLPATALSGMIDASVIHGGEGTVQTACLSGRPLAGIGLQAEQRYNVAECVRFGNALSLTSKDIRRGRLPDTVDRLLNDPSLAERALALADLASALDGAVGAAVAIEEYLHAGRSVPDG